MDIISLHKCIKHTSEMEHFSQLNTSRGPWKSKRTRKIPAELGRAKERKRTGKAIGWGLQPWGDLKRGEVSTSGEGPHWGSPVGTEGEPHPLWEENTASVRGNRTEETCTQVPPPALPTQPERVSTAADKGWGLECRVWRADPGRALLWAVRRCPVGMAGREELCKQECLGRRPEPP